ncbi:DNA polymerase III delta prime subunit [hydrothermal vent metagenome]|uniref:DNA polymerase III delta prime subunit n=1 Tax=hydrothermal vent metagenome TaxID=652676 RepID=A0A3B0USM3_9ZZZZ
MTQNAYVITGEKEKTLSYALEFLLHEYGLKTEANPDVIVCRYSLFSVDDARSINSIATLSPIGGEMKALVIVADRIYHEAQNAILKLLEEPPKGTIIILAVPQMEMLLPTVRSRVLQLSADFSHEENISDEARAFLDATKAKRTALIKKLTTGKDEHERRANRDIAIRIIDGVEVAMYAKFKIENERTKREALRALLSDIETLRGYLYDRSAPVRMILEHVSLCI